ncbi:beta-ketoacyl-ACP synthase III [Lentzea sp. NBRC 102530]|uniref:beta-ketoacyl-ACP synthase III n=1 Tax=Lentzea sp. NBRC 102530 TaxID=3032201 RepID=UPI0024A3B129|nr:beta-ketoacyl-ACP synthase III [Lentzea sp. NBRC 102530]GLY46455.1 3-oxoacyl-[acyl-carrier-protein] synthase 3 [Lentzea sp. NBRC 102530]
MSGSRVVALGHYQPERVLTNADLEKMVDTDDEWILQRTGIATRRIAAEKETVADMATEAGANALKASGLAPSDIGQVIVATCSAIDRSPSTAAQVAARLAIPSAVVFDLNNACAGFCTALATADHTVRAGAARHALVIGAEKMSDLVDWTDRSSCILLGDGAGAAVVSASDEARIGPAVWGSDPSRSNAVRLVNEWQPRFEQEGQSVFRWATSELPAVAVQACERAGIAVGDLAAVVTHQANLRIIEALTKRMGLPESVVVGRDVVESGNTSAASVPLALSKMAERGELPSGKPVLLFAFGGGLSWAGQVITAP